MHSNSLVWRLNILASGFCVQYARKRCFEEISLNAETNYYENTFKYQDILHYKSMYIFRKQTIYETFKIILTKVSHITIYSEHKTYIWCTN